MAKLSRERVATPEELAEDRRRYSEAKTMRSPLGLGEDGPSKPPPKTKPSKRRCISERRTHMEGTP